MAPRPPASTRLDPLIETWPAGKRIVRCYHSDFGATEFNPGVGTGRFHPLRVRGRAIPTIYGSDSDDGALSETIFHDVPIRGRIRRIQSSRLVSIVKASIVPKRDLRLAQLHGHGFHRLGVSRVELIESDADQYESTVVWAAALHRCAQAPDGLVWHSRQHDSSLAVVLFGDRVQRRELTTDGMTMALATTEGMTIVSAAAAAAFIRIDP